MIGKSSSFSRRQFGQSSVCLSLFPLTSCSRAEPALAEGTFNFSEIQNPKNPNSYRKKYTAPKNRYKTIKLKYEGETRKVHLYTPKRKTISAVLLLLHGSNRNGASMIDLWKRLANQHGIALIAPNSLNKNHWSFQADSFAFMEKIVTDFTAAESLTDLPIYGFGHSVGAIMMTHLSIRHGTYFKSVGAHAGNPKPYTLESYKTRKKPRAPLVHILGGKDHIFSAADAKLAAKTLVNQGQDVNLIVIKNHNHWYYDLADFINKKAWAAMTRQS